MLVIEGPDGSGKTTLVDKLEVALGMTREPRAVDSDGQALVEPWKWIEQQLSLSSDYPRLYDRFALISGPGYAMLEKPTFRGMMMDQVWLARRWQQFWAMNPMIVVCLPPYATVMENVISSNENRVVVDDIFPIWVYYQNFLAMNAPRVWWYNYKAINSEASVSLIANAYKAHHRLAYR